MAMSKKKIVATIECRMTSSRLPGKVMLRSCGKPMLEHIVERLRRVEKIDEIFFATTVNPEDDVVQELAEKLVIGYYRGSEEDVLRRVLETANSASADIIVEITGDCPFTDPEIVSQVLDLYLLNPCDYADNCLNTAFPVGLAVEVFSTELLELANREGTTPEDREHVSWFFVRNPDRFRILTLPAPPALSCPELRIGLDEQDDFRLIDSVFNALYPENPTFSAWDIIKFLKKNKELAEINTHVVQRNPE